MTKWKGTESGKSKDGAFASELASGLPAKQEQGEWKHTACALCLMCPMQVKVENGKIVEIKGEDILPWEGKLCAKAYGGIWGRVYAPDRILQPLKRAGKRGEGKFVPCSWEEVIEALSQKLKAYTDAGHPEYFEIWWGCPVQTDNMYFLHYWSRITGASISYLHGQVCFGDHAAEKAITFGENHSKEQVQGSIDFLNTKYAVMAAQNFPGTVFSTGTAFGASGFYRLFIKARENGFKYVTVSPKLADSAAMADEWLPIKPGTDTVFALGVANVIIGEKLYDEDFLLNYTNAPQLIRPDTGEALRDVHGNYLVWDTGTGSAVPMPEAGKREGLTLGLGDVYPVDGIRSKTAFALFSEMAGRFPAEKVVQVCKIPFSPEKIREIARNLGYHRPAAIFSPGFTTGRYPNWFQVLRCYSVVNMLLGNIERPGGWYFAKHKFNTGTGWPEPPEVPEYPRPELKVVPGPWGNLMSSESLDKAPCYTHPRQFHPATQALPWEHFQAIKEGRLKALLSTAENSAITQLDTSLVYDCLDELELIIVGEQEPKEFVELADYVIPEASYVERAHLYSFTPLGQDGNEHAIALMRTAAIPPLGDSKPITWFLTEVAKKLGLSSYFEKLDHQYGWWDKMLQQAGLPVTARDLEKKGPYEEAYPMTYDVLFKPITTRSRRFEIYSNELAEECYYNNQSPWHNSTYVNPLPVHIPIAEPKGRDEFYLISGKASWHQKNATQNNRYLMEDDLEGGFPYTPVHINSTRAMELGMKEGDFVEIECVGPGKKDDPCVWDDSVIGYRQRVRVHLTESVHPDAAFVHFAAGHKSNLMLRKSTEGILHSAFVPLSIEPYAGGCGKNYSLVKVRRVS